MLFFWLTIICGLGGLIALFAGAIGPGLALVILAALFGWIFNYWPDH